MWTVLRAADLKPIPWRNGQGTTRDVLTSLAPDGALLWQVSIADLVRDADFSNFTGLDRIFTPTDRAVELCFDDGPFVPCPALTPVPFAGERRTRCRVPNGPARALNAIWDRTAHTAAVRVLHLAGGQPVHSEGATAILHCLGGMVAVGDERLGAGDSSYGPGNLPASALGDATVVQVSVR